MTSTEQLNVLLFDAIIGRRIEEAKKLIKTVTDVNVVNKLGLTPLHHAAEEGHIEIVSALIKKGANVNAVDRLFVQEILFGMTPLHYAAKWGHIEIVNILIKEGANIDAVDRLCESTPLHLAVEKNYIEVVNVLVKCGAKVNMVDRYRKTPLYWAIEKSQVKTIESLLENGADIDKISHNEITIEFITAPAEYQIDACKPVVNHIVRLEVADLYVSEKNLQRKDKFINTSTDRRNNYSQHSQNCKEEVRKLKKESGSLYDFLRESNVDQLTGIWEKNIDVRDKFDNQESLKEQYPEYAYILINKANEVKKEIFLHNHKPLMDALSTYYGNDFQSMTFTGIRNFFKTHKNDLKEERKGIKIRNNTLIDFADFEDVKERHVPTLKTKAFAEMIKNKDINSKLECTSTVQPQQLDRAFN